MRSTVATVFAFALLGWPLSLHADESPPPAAVRSATPAAEPERKPPPGFERVPSGEARGSQVNANAMVVGAYAAFFLGLFGFVITVVRGQAAMAREIKELSEKLDRAQQR